MYTCILPISYVFLMWKCGKPFFFSNEMKLLWILAVVKATLFRVLQIRCCIINGGTDMREQRAELEGPGVSVTWTVDNRDVWWQRWQGDKWEDEKMRCVKKRCLELSQFCHNFVSLKMEGFKIMVLQWWLIDWLGSLDSLGSVHGSTLLYGSTLLWFYASVIISNVYLVCNSAAWYLWCIAPDSLKCLGIPNSFPMHLRSYLELGWFKSFFCLANFTQSFRYHHLRDGI